MVAVRRFAVPFEHYEYPDKARPEEPFQSLLWRTGQTVSVRRFDGLSNYRLADYITQPSIVSILIVTEGPTVRWPLEQHSVTTAKFYLVVSILIVMEVPFEPRNYSDLDPYQYSFNPYYDGRGKPFAETSCG